MVEKQDGFSFRILADAGALPEGAIDIIKAKIDRGLKRYLKAVKRGEYLEKENFITVEELLNTSYDQKVVPLLPRRKPGRQQ